MRENFTVKGKLDASGFNGEAARMRGNAEAAATASGKLGKALGAVGIAAVAVTGALIGAVALYSKATAASRTQLEAELKLASAIKGTGKAIDAVKIQRYASELQGLTTFGDEATIQAAALVTGFGLEEDQIISLLPRIQNLAAMYGLTLDSAAQKIAKTVSTGTNTLERQGVILTEHEKKAFKAGTTIERMALLTGKLDQTTGDAAQSLAAATGGLLQADMALGDVWETLGDLIQQDGNRWFADLAVTIASANSAIRNFFSLSGTSAKETADQAVVNRAGNAFAGRIEKNRAQQAGLRAAMGGFGGASGFRSANLPGLAGLSDDAAMGALEMRGDELQDELNAAIASARKSVAEIKKDVVKGPAGDRGIGGTGKGKGKRAGKGLLGNGDATGPADAFYSELGTGGAADLADLDAALAEEARIRQEAEEAQEARIDAMNAASVSKRKSLADEARKAAEANAKALIKIKAAEEKEKTRLAAEAQAEQQANMRRGVDVTLGIAESAVSRVFGNYLDAVESAAAGQQIAFDQMAAGFVKATGQQIMGIGSKFFFEGAGNVAMGLLPGGQANVPGGLAMMAVGASAMAAGGVMATTGAVASGLISKRDAAAGGGGGSRSTGGGASGRRGRGGAGAAGGEAPITIVFQGGTHLGDTTERARTMARDRARATRNVYLATG